VAEYAQRVLPNEDANWDNDALISGIVKLWSDSPLATFNPDWFVAIVFMVFQDYKKTVDDLILFAKASESCFLWPQSLELRNSGLSASASTACLAYLVVELTGRECSSVKTAFDVAGVVLDQVSPRRVNYWLLVTA
jgi:hypothetical protein